LVQATEAGELDGVLATAAASRKVPTHLSGSLPDASFLKSNEAAGGVASIIAALSVCAWITMQCLHGHDAITALIDLNIASAPLARDP
jgi:hypothetical protein